ncbi:hypothetical protein ElyMa_002436900 [Elysia marginata]|uniref:Uncharacterized protein n=1 Tax=Elysia marginata TaxID=1093978 RepID=A0AAV4GHP5_9GAST|nr:hypothetical protein ElyMa_002436900 [Elysia marginata]
MWSECTGTFHSVCRNWTATASQPRLHVKWSDLEPDFLTQGTLSLSFHVNYDGGPIVEPVFEKRFFFGLNKIRVDIIWSHRIHLFTAAEENSRYFVIPAGKITYDFELSLKVTCYKKFISNGRS